MTIERLEAQREIQRLNAIVDNTMLALYDAMRWEMECARREVEDEKLERRVA